MKNYNAEHAVIGSMLIDDACISSMLQILTPADFESDTARVAFSAMAKLWEDKKPVDLITVAAECGGGVEDYLLECAEITPTAANADEYAAIVKRESCARKVQRVGHDLVFAGDDYREDVLRSIERLTDIADDSSGDVIGGASWATHFAEEEAKIIADPDAAFCKTSYEELDNMLGGGLFNGGLYILGARPGMGKTTFAINVAEKIVKRGAAVLYISLEMNSRQIMCKRISCEANIPYRVLMNGRMSAMDRERMERGIEELRNRPMFVNQRFNLTVNDIAALSRQVSGCKAVVVDYFGLIAVEGDGRGRYEDYTAISGRLKQLACKLDVPILCLAQLNRESEKRANKRPTLSDLRDTGAIEQDADGVIFLHRNGYYKKEEKPDSETIEVILAKNRHGETGTVKMYWMGSFGRIAGIERHYDDEPL